MPHFELLTGWNKYCVRVCLHFSNGGNIRGQKLGSSKTKAVWNYLENVKLFTCQKSWILVKCFGAYKQTSYGSFYFAVATLNLSPVLGRLMENFRIKNLLLDIKLHYISQ